MIITKKTSMKKIIYVAFIILLTMNFGYSQTAYSINSFPSVPSSRYTLAANTGHSIQLSVFIDTNSTLNGFTTTLDGNHELTWDLTAFNKNEWIDLEHDFTTTSELVNPVFNIEIIDDSNSGTGYGTFFIDNIKIYDNSLLSIPELENEIIIAPNPVKNNLTLQNLNPNTEVSIYNIVGSKIEVEVNNKNEVFTIPMTNLPQGIYLVKLVNSNNIFIKKIIKK